MLSTEEKKGGSIVRDQAREWVEDIILHWDLMDVKPPSGKFTWSNKRLGPGHIAARLDRFLIHLDFLSSGMLATSKILPNSTSDHRPILLDILSDAPLGPIPFRFSPLWLLQDNFQQVVANSWSLPMPGSPSFTWEQKIKRLEAVLKSWAKLLSTPTSIRISAQKSLESHQHAMDSVRISSSTLSKEAELQKAYFKACRVEEEFWRQKSRSLWLKSGD